MVQLTVILEALLVPLAVVRPESRDWKGDPGGPDRRTRGVSLWLQGIGAAGETTPTDVRPQPLHVPLRKNLFIARLARLSGQLLSLERRFTARHNLSLRPPEIAFILARFIQGGENK